MMSPDASLQKGVKSRTPKNAGSPMNATGGQSSTVLCTCLFFYQVLLFVCFFFLRYSQVRITCAEGIFVVFLSSDKFVIATSKDS